MGSATKDPRPVLDVVTDYVTWLQQLPEPRMFAASPITFDGAWIDFYLRRFTRFGLTQGPYERDVLFHGPGLCLRSYAAAITGRPVSDVSPSALPASWFGNVQHSHRAIDDALGYTYLLGELHRRSPQAARDPSGPESLVSHGLNGYFGERSRRCYETTGRLMLELGDDVVEEFGRSQVSFGSARKFAWLTPLTKTKALLRAIVETCGWACHEGC